MTDTTGPHRVVAVAIAPQSLFELSAAAHVFESASARSRRGYVFEVCTAVPGPVAALGSFGIHVPLGLAALDSADTVILSGYAPAARDADAGLLEALVRTHTRGARIAAIGSGVLLLAETGLLDGRSATVDDTLVEFLTRRHPRVRGVPGSRVIDHGDVVTSAGGMAAVSLCLQLVRNDLGAAFSEGIAAQLDLPPSRRGSSPDGSDAAGRVAESRRLTASDELEPVLDWARERLGEPLAIGDLAAKAHVSVRTLNRRFRALVGSSPGRWLLDLRIDAACHLLEHSDLTVEAIAARVGLSTAANLRMRLRRSRGMSPSEYRLLARSPARS